MSISHTYTLLTSLLLIICSYSANAITATLQPIERTISINQKVLTVEVAHTPEQRQQGLMNRAELLAGRGMLFDFGKKVTPCFWMKNTYIPLSLAFISSDYKITQIEPLMPQDLTNVCSNIAIRYAIEVPLGWFSDEGIKEGMQVKGINHP